MREGIGTHAAGGFPLQAVIANRGGGTQSRGYIRLINDLALRGGVSPYAGEAVGLQFDADGDLIACTRLAPAEPCCLVLYTEDFLYMMPDFVCKHVRLGEFAGSAEAPAELIEKSQIEVDLFVRRTVERSSSRLRKAARRIDRVAIEHEP